MVKLNLDSQDGIRYLRKIAGILDMVVAGVSVTSVLNISEVSGVTMVILALILLADFAAEQFADNLNQMERV